MTHISSSVSPALLAAQVELHRRRAEWARQTQRISVDEQRPLPSRAENNSDSSTTAVAHLPAHLGWGSVAPAQPAVNLLPRATSSESTQPLPEHIKIFGHLLDAIHRQGDDSLGRVWLLLRVLDGRGEGRVPVELMRHEITEANGRLHCFSWRRLRQLLQQGENRFWHRDKHNEYIYYHSEARVAKELNIDRIRGWAVKIPVADLLQGVTAVRALFHDCFHSARGDGFNEPITRRVMEQRGGGDPRTQRRYEQLRGVESHANYANVGEYSKEALAWHKGRDAEEDFEDKTLGPAFTFVDFNGTLGKSHNREQRPKHQQHWHKVYILRQMANSYEGTLRTVKRGRKWTNRKLTHLCNTKEIRGSCEEAIRLYYGSAKAVAKVSKERPLQTHFLAQSDVIWQVHHAPFVE